MTIPAGFSIRVASDQFSVAAAQKVIDSISEIFTGASSALLLEKLQKKTIYIVAALDPTDVAYVRRRSHATQMFYDVVGGAVSSTTSVGSADGETITLGVDIVAQALTNPYVLEAASTNGPTLMTLPRVLFHELAHAVTIPNFVHAKEFGNDGTPYAGIEALAVAAENLIYAKDRFQSARVGHSAWFGVRSFDPTLPFANVANVQYDEVVSKGRLSGNYTGLNTDAGQITKSYADISKEYNLVSVTGHKASGLVSDAGTASKTFIQALSGILGDQQYVLASLKQVSDTLMTFKKASEAISTIATGSIPSLLAEGYGGGLSAIGYVTGNSNERFTDYTTQQINYVGPVHTNGTHALGLTSGAPAILIGAAGFSETSKDVDLSSAGEDITGADGGRNVIIAGSGAKNAKHLLRGGTGDDVILGSIGNDSIYADKGTDLVFQSKGSDTVYGSTKTVFVASKGQAAVTFDTSADNGSTLLLSEGEESTYLENVHSFAGNKFRTKFIGNGKTPETFIAGAGGGDFTLKNGDTAIGSPDVANIYRLSTDLDPTTGQAATITIVNLGPKDVILVDGERFDGNTHAYDVTASTYVDYIVTESGTSSWTTKYPNSTLKENFYRQTSAKVFDPVADLPGALNYLALWGLNSQVNVDTLTMLHNFPDDIYVVYSVEQLYAQNGYFPQGKGVYYIHDANDELPYNSAYEASVPGHSYLTQTASDMSFPGQDRRDVAFVKAGSAAAGTIVFSATSGGSQVAGLNLSVTGFINGVSAGGVKFSTNDLDYGGGFVPKPTGQFGPEDPRWQQVYHSTIVNGATPSTIDVSTPATSLGRPFDPVNPTTTYGNGYGGVGYSPGDVAEPLVLTGDLLANDLSFAGTYQIIVGGGGGDTLHYAVGDGSVTIEEVDTPALPDNILEIGAGVTPDGISIAGDPAGDLILRLEDGSMIVIRQALLSTDTTRYGVQQVRFDDGTVWSYDDLVTRAAQNEDAADFVGDAAMQMFRTGGNTRSVIGGGGGDVIEYVRGSGAVTVTEFENDADAVNVLRFGADVLPEDIAVTGDVNGNLLIDLGDGDTLTIAGGLANRDANTVRYGVQSIEFVNGTTWTLSDVLLNLTGPNGQSTLFGDGNAQNFDTYGSARGIVGGGGGDTFVYDAGYGPLVINEVDGGPTPANALHLGWNLSSSQMTVRADTRGNLVLDFGGEDRVTLVGALLSEMGATRGVQQVVFSAENDLTLSYQDLLALADTASANNLRLIGDAGANAFDPLGISTSIVGRGGGDTIAYDKGYGALSITEADGPADADNEIHLGAGIATGDVTVTATASGDLVLDLGDGDAITIVGGLRSGTVQRFGVQKVLFDDNTVWSYGDLLSMVSTAGVGRTTIYGDATANSLDTAGTATTVVGGGGGDTFLFDAGYGEVTIDERGASESTSNVLELGAGIDPLDLVVSGSGDGDIILDFGSGDKIILKGALASDAGVTAGVQQLTFSDNTVVTYDDLLALVSTATLSNASIFGDRRANVLDPLGLAHSATGGGGGDTFVYQTGYGALVIDERDVGSIPDNTLALGTGIDPGNVAVSASADGDLILDLGSGDQITITKAMVWDADQTFGVQQVIFDDGTAWSYEDIVLLADTAAVGKTHLYGDSNANTLDGAGVSGTLVGNGGGDTFVFNSGYGSLMIDENDEVGGSPNVLAFGAGIDPDDITVTANEAGDLILTAVDGDEVHILNALKNIDGSGTVSGVQFVTFADNTVWSYENLITRLAPIAGALYGDSNAQEFNVDGLASSIVGRGGGDRIHFVLGQGSLAIDETDEGVAPNNALYLDGGIGVSDVAVGDDGNGNAVLSIGTADAVTILGQFDEALPNSVRGVQAIHFGDGTVWDAAKLLEVANGTVSQSLAGAGVDIDEAQLKSGNRPIISIDPSLTLSDLDVTLEPGGSVLTLSHWGEAVATFRNILVLGAMAEQSIQFADSTTITLGDLIASIDLTTAGSLRGTKHAETIDGKGALARVNGGGGGDTFIFNAGYGLLEIDETDVAGGAFNTLQIGTGIDPADVEIIGTEAGDLILKMGGDDQVTLLGALRSGDTTLRGVQSIVFADSTTWTHADLLGRRGLPTTPEFEIFGDASAQTIDTQGLTHAVFGGGGGDTINYDTGYGFLRIYETDPAASPINVLQFAAGISSGDVVVTGDASGNIVLDLGAGDTIKIDNQAVPNGGFNFGLDEIRYADNTVWNRADLVGMAYPNGDPFTDSPADTVGDTGDNNILGNSLPDLLIGNGGDDYLSGAGGDDEYRYASGDGDDVINENGLNSDVDTLTLTDLNPADVGLEREGGHLLVTDLSTGQRVRVYSQFGSDIALGIEQIKFADNTIWNRTQIASEAVIVGTSSTDYMSGTEGDENFDGRGGDDMINGGAGSDIYRYASGDGNDTISESGSSTDADILRLSDLEPSDVTLSRDNLDLLVRVTSTSEVIRIQDHFSGAASGIEWIEFADATTWDRAKLAFEAKILGTSDNDYLFGAADTEVLIGGTGDDYLAGSGGADEYRYASGDGNDTIEDLGSNGEVDKLLLTDLGPADVELRRMGADLRIHILATGDEITAVNQFHSTDTRGIEQIVFADSTTWGRTAILAAAPFRGTSGDDLLAGSAGVDTLIGRGGNDRLEGRGGSDEYRYASGDGNDRIHEAGNATDVDNLVLIDLNPNDVTLRREGRNLILTDTTTGHEVTVDNQFYGDGRFSIEQITFADSTIWARGDIAERAAITGTSGTDTLRGFTTDDLLVGMGGDDSIDGGAGVDVALYHGASTDYSVTSDGNGGFAVEDTIANRDGADSLVRIETLRFSDGDFSPDDLVPSLRSSAFLGMVSESENVQANDVNQGGPRDRRAFAQAQVDDWAHLLTPEGFIGRYATFGRPPPSAIPFKPSGDQFGQVVSVTTQASAEVQRHAAVLVQALAGFVPTGSGEFGLAKFVERSDQIQWAKAESHTLTRLA